MVYFKDLLNLIAEFFEVGVHVRGLELTLSTYTEVPVLYAWSYRAVRYG